MRISTAWRNRAVSGVDLIDVGAGTAKLQLRTGAPPTNLTDAAAGTLLVEFDLPNPAFDPTPVSPGVVEANLPADTPALATGTVGHFRVLDRDGDPVEDSGSVGGQGSGEELELSSVELTEAVDVRVLSWSVTMPEA